jgi:hypothetical protein
MRWAIRLTALLLSIETVAMGVRPGYLVTVGPSALRFQQPPAPKPMIAVLPPLPAMDTAPVAGMTSLSSAPAPSVTQQDTHRSTNDTVAAQSPSSLALPLLPETTNDVLVTPQMLLEFFRGKTAHETSVILPLNFIPPQPLDRPSSTASYESP